VPELNRWAELMSLDWQSPDAIGSPGKAATADAASRELGVSQPPAPAASAVETTA
jgi:hypothetical protein